MLFENMNLSVSILDVLELRQTNVNMENRGRSFFALSYRISSDACLRYRDKVCIMGNGAVCSVPAGLDYTRTASKDELIVIHFTAENYITHNIDTVYPKNGGVVEALFHKILETWQDRPAGYRYRCTALLYEILAECCIVTEKSGKNEKISEGVDYLNMNYKSPVASVSEAARRCFMSEVYFRKLFKASYGISPRKYLIRLRTQNAARLISRGYYSLKEIADMCGYSDYKYFSIEFKSVMGCSPSKYSYGFSDNTEELI